MATMRNAAMPSRSVIMKVENMGAPFGWSVLLLQLRTIRIYNSNNNENHSQLHMPVETRTTRYFPREPGPRATVAHVDAPGTPGPVLQSASLFGPHAEVQ